MRLRPLVLLTLLARIAAAQAPDTNRRATGASVSGVVRDSIARLPLAGATVQLVAAGGQAIFGRTVLSDSLGRFTMGDVPEGRYTLGFFHPMLDSLGVDAPLREVHVGHRSVRADLSVPSPARLRAAICGSRTAPNSRAVVVGVVRGARDRAPVNGVKVIGEWLEFSFTTEGVVRRVPRLVAATGENGWFAMCNVPSAGTMALIAIRGADSTDRIEVQVPAEGFLRRELYLGPRTGDGRLSGTVVSVAEGRPLAGAQVRITGGLITRANERGEWTLVDLPLGTRMLEVRAVGYYPARRPVDVIPAAPTIHTSLSTMKAMLDTVKVTAARLTDRRRSGFDDRHRTGPGRYLTAADIARRELTVTSDLFRMMPGIRVDNDTSGSGKRVLMRGAFATDTTAGGRRDLGEVWCSPAIYLDGYFMKDITAGDIDTWVHPAEVAGIEIYTESSAPAQFHLGLSDCGAIVIWTK